MKIRDWLESKRFYWYSLQISVYPLPYHWTREYENHNGWFKWNFGPIGVFIVKPYKEGKNVSE